MPINEPQPDPIQNDGPAIWDLVIQDMNDRDRIGQERYKTRLQANNGRDMLTDAYQEAFDLAVYLRGAIVEREGATELAKLRAKLAHALALTDTGSPEFREAFAKDTQPHSGWRVVEKIREVLNG